MIREQGWPEGADRRSRLGGRASASRSPDAPTEDHMTSQRGGRARFDEELGSSNRRACQRDGWTLKSEREVPEIVWKIRYMSSARANRDDRGEILPTP